MLSDHHGAKKGKKTKDVADGEGDIGAIGRILQKALQKRSRDKEITIGGGLESVRVIGSVIHVPVSKDKLEESRSRIMTATSSSSSLSSGRTSGNDLYSIDDLSQNSTEN